MYLISCNHCGVVIDKNKLHFSYNIYNEDGIDMKKAGWNGDDYVAKDKCPVCKEDIFITD